MNAVKTNLTFKPDREDIEAIMILARNRIPHSLGQGHDHPRSWSGFVAAPDSEPIMKNMAKAQHQLGSLGAGNHFIEMQYGDDGRVWLMIHSGSRGLGHNTATYYNKQAAIWCDENEVKLPAKGLAYLPMEHKLGQEYYDAMTFCIDYAAESRKRMMETFLDCVFDVFSDVKGIQQIDLSHNFAREEEHYGKKLMVHRKGATFAGEGSWGIIPGSMGTKSYIVRGKGNPESFNSCSHGAGRTMSRTAAKNGKKDVHGTVLIEALDFEEQRDLLKDVVHGMDSVKKLDEAPGAYKNIGVVMGNQTDLIDIEVELTAIGNIKG